MLNIQIIGNNQHFPLDELRPNIPVEEGVLIEGEYNFPIHKQSLNVLAYRDDRYIYAFVPAIPTSSELGVPKYNPVFYWIPKLKPGIREDLSIHQIAHGTQRRIVPVTAPSGQCTLEEQVYYFADNFSRVSPKPIQCSVVVSNICNLKCTMCPYHSPLYTKNHKTTFLSDKNSMSWEMMEEIAQECGRHKIPVKMGNIEEPMAHKHIVKFIETCRKEGVPTVHITSNGTLMKKKKAEALLKAGLTSLYISIDAYDPDTYLKIRGSKLEKVEENLLNFLELRKTLNPSCVVMVSVIKNDDLPKEELNKFITKWADLVDGIIVYNLAKYDDAVTHFEEINPRIAEKIKKIDDRWACVNPFQEVYITPDRRVFYCCETLLTSAYNRLETMGAYSGNNLPEIWGGPQFTKLRKDHITNDIEKWEACKDCTIWMAHVQDNFKEGPINVTQNMITTIYRK